eukprot:TRINITY_DN2323_c0_g1_i1.p1 TRINITY_DN2323_c0_g1~~TRINITY_DN2323_c0_g1_i1.p1  ORF type:complete len:209 (+),score=29.18 TRINITY_DN2323_c0_g1_i1:413-1039(+)
MKRAGVVLHADVFRDARGKSKGCGLVEMATMDDARKAIRMMNGSVLDGRPIHVREDDIKMSKYDHDVIKKMSPDRYGSGSPSPDDRYRSRSPSFNRGRRHRSRSRERERREVFPGSAYGRPQPDAGAGPRESFKIEVRNLPADIKQHQLLDLFKEFGPILNCNLIGNDSFGMRYGLVQFEYKKDAERATRTMNNTIFGGMKLTVIKEF